jgi:hypothetical protein
MEVISELILAGATCPPSQLATGLSTDWLQAIREHTASPPKNPSDVFRISGGTYRAGFEREGQLHEAKMDQLCFDGTWNWFKYFAEPVAPADGGRDSGS